VDRGHGRIEWRGIEVREVTPEQMGFPHVAQVARIDRIRELKNGRQEVETVWIITSLTAAQAEAARLLELARQYWSIENGTHYPLDVSAGEDRCRVRHPVAATVLGILRRAVQGEARAWARRQPRARDRTCPTFLAKMSRRQGEVIRCLTRPVRL
jgi:hypothetical protein